MPTYRLRKFDPVTGQESIQYGFAQSRKPIQIFGGGYGNGKTTALVVKALKLARDYPGSNGLLARETYPKLNDTLRKEFLSWCPPEWIKRRPTQDDNTCYLTNGTVINFRYIAQRGKQREDGSTTSNLLSATYDWIGIDQIEDPGITEKDFDDLLGRLRGSTTYRPPDDEDDPTMPSTGPRWIMVTANPSAGWFYKHIVQPFITWRDRGIKTEKLLVDSTSGVPIIDLFEGSTYTNAHNLPADFLRNLEAKYKGQQRERYLLGKWAAFEGLVYGDFDPKRHLITRAQADEVLHSCMQRHVRVEAIEGYDFGISSPSCYIFGFVDDYGRIVLYDGFYERELPYTRQPARIQDIRAKHRQFIRITRPIYADPAIFKRSVIAGMRAAGQTIASLYEEMGTHMRPASNDILPGIAKTGAYLNGRDDVPHLITGETPGPMLYIVDDLEWFVDEITNFFWKRNPQGQNIDEPMDTNDHAMDAVRYLISKLPLPSEVVLPKDKMPPAWMYWQEGELAH